MDGTVDGGAWLGLRDAARALGISEKTARRWVKAGQLRGRQVPTQHGAAWEAWVPGGVDAAGRVDGGGTQAMTMLELVRLVGELQAKAESAAMWQGRAELLAAELASARATIRALEAPREAPTGAPQSRQEGQETASPGGVVQEPTPEQPAPWWRRLWAAVAGA
jgi:hypothetical protein